MLPVHRSRANLMAKQLQRRDQNKSTLVKLVMLSFVGLCFIVAFVQFRFATRSLERKVEELELPVPETIQPTLQQQPGDVDVTHSIERFLTYWEHNDPRSTLERAPPKNDLTARRKYVTFEDDGGGWNNIRMAFEVFVLVAKVTQRTLVLPPDCRFYLLDRGPIKLFPKVKSSVSHYGQYFDLDYLKQTVDIISTQEFLQLEGKTIGVPEDMIDTVINGPPVSNGDHTPYFLFLRESRSSSIWPSGPSANAVFTLNTPDPTSIAIDDLMIHFPLHNSRNLRYLSGVPKLLKASRVSHNMVLESRRFIRDNVHYTRWIINAARFIIERLGGPESYNSIHIRRNDLQYKNVFLGAEASLSNIAPLLGVGTGSTPLRKLYIATDETESGFFEAFRARNIVVRQLSHFQEMDGYEEAFLGRKYIAKFEGMVEQLVCASANVFVATPLSTFSAYINRLRGYLRVKNTQCYYHTRKYRSEGDEGECNSFAPDVLMGHDLW